MKCRNCSSLLTTLFADLGSSPPSNSYIKKEQLNDPEATYPLKLFVCNNCLLVQIDEIKKAEEIFCDEYAYFSSYSNMWLNHCQTYTEMVTSKYSITNHSFVIEVASNDGYMLQYFLEKNIPVLGIEPTSGTAKAAIEKGIPTRIDFFSTQLASTLKAEGITADLIIGNNVLAHIPDVHDFVNGLRILLKDNGVITLEFPHLLKLIEYSEFDTIYHEHFSYFSLFSVSDIMDRQNLTIFDVEELPTHGGSLRLYVKHKSDHSKQITNNVKIILDKEYRAGLLDIKGYLGFQEKMEQIKANLLSFLYHCKEQGKSVAAYGAAAKGNTLLNYCGITTDLIKFVVDRSPHKQNKYLPGSRIPIHDESAIVRFKPDFILILPWNIKEEIMGQLSYVRQWGGQFVLAIPSQNVL